MNVIDKSKINLNTKVDTFINWYFENMVKGIYTEIGEYHFPINMRNFIEKMAVWYELRYPDYEINKLLYCSAQEEKNINDIMFKKNPYINNLLDENSSVKELEWNDFYNTDVFIKSLPFEERCLLSNPHYRSIDNLYFSKKSPFNLYLTENGFVKNSENVSNWTNHVVEDEELVNLHVKEVIELFNKKGIKLPKNSELERIINDVDKRIYCKEEMLNCVMYRIIERGGNRIGPRRAFLYAKEFERNIDIPMMYAVDYSDPGLRLFINEYIKSGGFKDLECYIGYFSKINEDDKIDTVSIQQLILKQKSNASTFYTEEETNLHQRLVNLLASQVDPNEVKQENIKRLRIERKIKNSKIKK